MADIATQVPSAGSDLLPHHGGLLHLPEHVLLHILDSFRLLRDRQTISSLLCTCRHLQRLICSHYISHLSVEFTLTVVGSALRTCLE